MHTEVFQTRLLSVVFKERTWTNGVINLGDFEVQQKMFVLTVTLLFKLNSKIKRDVNTIKLMPQK